MAKDLNYFKSKLLAILDAKEKNEKTVTKALEFNDYFQQMNATMGSIEKGASLPIGTKKEWPNGSGKWYIKTGTGWIRTYNNSDSRGAKMSIALTKKKIQNAKSLEELLAIVEQNKDKFTDDNGKRLPIVSELMAEVHTKQQGLKGKTPAATPSAEPKKRKYDRPMDQNIVGRYKEEAFGMRMRTSDHGKNLDAGKEAMEKFINDKKELMAGNQKDIDAGKDPEGKLEEYNRYYEKQIEAYQKELDRLNNDIKARDEKKAAAKKAREEKKAAKEAEKKKQEEAKLTPAFAEEAIIGAQIADCDENKLQEYVTKTKELINTFEARGNPPTVIEAQKENLKGFETAAKIQHTLENLENATDEEIKEAKEKLQNFVDVAENQEKNGHKTYATQRTKKELPKKIKQIESEEEKRRNRSEAMMGNQNAKKDGVPDPEEAKKEAKKWNDVFDYYMNDHNNGVGHWFSWASRKGQDKHSKAFGRAEGFKNLIKMRERLKTEYGLDTPEIPAELLDKYNAYLEARKGVPGYSSAGEDILSGIRANKIDEAFEAIMQPIRDKYKEAKNSMNTEAIENVVTPLPNLSNDEHAELFELREDPNATDGTMRLYYNGKPYGDNAGYENSSYGSPLEEQKKLIRNAGMDPKSQFEYQLKEYTDRKDYYIGRKDDYKRSYRSLGEKKLKEIMKPSMSDEEFEKVMLEKMNEKTRAYNWINKQIRVHLANKVAEEAATELYNEKFGEGGASEALNAVDIPVDPKDMDEAANIIAGDVSYITGGGRWASTTRATLKDKIERRVRNNPALARAMLVYIKQKQQETGKVVFTERNEIWQTLAKLNKNAMESFENGETETKTGSSGEMYTGDGISSVVENKDAGRYQITFTGKPDYDTRTLLKQNGFRWAPSTGTWQCYNTSNGQRSLERVAEKLGWKKA